MMRPQGWVWLIAILLLGSALRFYQIDSAAFRGDEAFTVQNWITQSIGETLNSPIVTTDPHPPLAYALFRWWSLLMGKSEFSLRVLPALLSMLGIPAMYALGRHLGNHEVGVLAAFLWAIHPFIIWHAQDTRNYAIWSSTSLLTVWLALRAVHHRGLRSWLLYMLAAIISAYVYYLEAFMIVVLNTYVLLRYWRQWRVYFQWITAQMFLGGVMALWYLQPRLLYGSGYGGTTGGFSFIELVTDFVPALVFGTTIPEWPILGIILSVGFGLSLLMIARRRWQNGLLLTLMIIIPMLLLGLVSIRLNVFTPRYILGSAPAYVLIFALVVYHLWVSGRLMRLLGAVSLVMWIGLVVVSLNNHYHNAAYRKAPDWPAMVTYLVDNTTSDEVIIQLSVDAGFGYYYETLHPPAGEFALPETPQQPADAIVETLEETAATVDSIWITGTTFRDWVGAGVVEAWLNENMQQVRRTSIAGQPIVQYKNWQVPDALLDTVRGEWQNTTKLVGQHIFDPEPTHDLTIWLSWQPIAQTDTPLTAFVHLVGDINPATGSPLWSQDDHPPQNGRISTTTWDTQTIYRDIFVLPLKKVVAGQYAIYAGFYDPEGNRVLTSDGEDAVLLGELTLP